MRKWIVRRGLLAATALVAAGMGFAEPAWARTNYGLLVAVTAYPNLPPKASLVGPNHDAKLVRDYLLGNAPVKFETQNLTLLADGVDGAKSSPTHAHIIEALKDIAAKAQRDDFVYLHFSGHGAQQPALDPTSEIDGLDEIFLPADTGKWADQTKGVPNALMDDDIGAALDAIRDKGAFVWVIFDACHSGTATRDVATGSDDLAIERKLDFADLGIPQAAVAAAEANASAAPAEPAERQPAFKLTEEADSGGNATRAVSLNGTDQSATSAEPITKGGMVAFFAAQTVETTPEMPLPKGNPDAERFGLFTYTIFSKLAENPNMTYRQLGHAVLQQYTADSRQRPTPLFEGELDARVFGSEKIDMVMQWPVEIKDNAATIQAGMLHRLAPGTKLAILPSPASELTDTVGYLEVKTAKNLTSTVVPVAVNRKPPPLLSDLPPNAYARLSELAVDFKLKVARPAASDALKAEVAEVNAVLDALNADKEKRFNVELVDSTAEADLRLAVLRENEIAGAEPDASDKPALFFLPASGDVSVKGGQKPPLVVIGGEEKLEKGVGDNLLKIFRATSLARLAAASDYQPDQVSVQFQIRRENKDALEPLDASSVPIVSPGDEIHILAENKSNKLVDINILYVGSDYSITHIDAQRLVGGAKIEEGLLAFTDSSFGMERMIAVLTEAPPQSEVEDLKFLEQGGVPPATRSASVSQPSFSDMLTDIGMAPSTRSVMKLGDKGGSKGAVMIFPMETVPRP